MKNLYLQKISDLLSKTKGPYEDEELQGAYKMTAQYVNEKMDEKGK